MSASEPGDRNSVLYLQQIDIETTTRRNIRIKLQLDGKDFEVRQGEQPSTWVPSRSLEITDVSKVTVVIKAGHTMAGVSIRKQEALAEFSVEEAIKAFWNSEDTISDKTMFDQQPVVVTFKLCPSPSSKTTRAAVKELQKEMKVFRPIMSDATEHRADLVFKSGAVLAEMNPIVKVAFGVAKGVFEVLKEQKKREEALSDLADAVGRILPCAELVIEDIICEETQLLERTVTKLCALIRDAASFICSHVTQSLAMRTMNSTMSKESSAKIKALTSDFAKLEREFDRAIDVTVLNMAKRNEEFRLLDRLRPADAAGYQEGRSCMDGTRTGVLNYLTAWALNPVSQENLPNGSRAANMYWLYGSPGLGKTSIANSLCDRLHGSKNLGGSFFCRRDDPIFRDPRRILPTLISKLAGMWGPYRKLVAQVLQDDPQLNPESKRGEVLLSLIQSVEKQPLRTLVLVVDALDECGDPGTQKMLLTCLLKACSRICWVRIIITSRPEHDLKAFFEQNHVESRDLAEDDETHADIWRFTRHRMASLEHRPYITPTDWPGEERLKQVVDRSGGLFIFVETVCRFVDDPKPDALLDEVLDTESGKGYADLNKLYSTVILSRLGKHKETFRLFAQAVVTVAAYRPLPDETIASLMGLELGIVRYWVDRLNSILYRDGSANGGIRVRHLSILDFLTGPACPQEFRVVFSHANESLGLRCLTTMITELRFNICELESSCLSNVEIPDLEDRVRRRISDALQYSCMYWAVHLCATLDIASTGVYSLLDLFFTGKRLLHWVEVLSLMGKIPIGISALRQIKASVKKFQHRHQDQVADALRFLLAFSTPISMSAPHIYISALPFSPTGSILWNSARKASTKLMKVYKGCLDSWPAPSGTWVGHQDRVWSVSYSPDGRYVASGSGDCTLRIWDAESGAAVGEPLSGHTGDIYSVAYSPDGRYIASGSRDSIIKIWDVESGAAVGDSLNGHTGPVTSVAYSPNGRYIASGSRDNTIRIWDVELRSAAGEPLNGHTDAVRSVAYSPDGRYIASGSRDNTLRIWDAESGEAVGGPLNGHTGIVWSVTYSPDGRYIASGSRDCTLRIWDAESRSAVGRALNGHTDSVRSVIYSPDGRFIASGSMDNTIRIWDAESGVAVGEPLKGHSGEPMCDPLQDLTGLIWSVSYSPDGRYIASGCSDRTIRIWDAELGKAVDKPLRGHIKEVNAVAYSPNGRYVVSGSDDNTIRIWHAESGAAVGEPFSGNSIIKCVAYSLDGRYVASGSTEPAIRIWDTGSGTAVGEPLKGHTGNIYSIAYSPDGRFIASGASDNTMQIWDAQSQAAVVEASKGHTGTVRSVAYSPDGRYIASGSVDCTLRIWDAESGAAVGGPLNGHIGVVWSVAYSPDGRCIASGSSDKTIRIWDVKSRVEMAEPLRGHTIGILSIAYSPDGRYIASGSADLTIRIWDARSGATIGQPLRGHKNMVWSVAYSSDGRYLASGSEDKTIRIWDVEPGAPLIGHAMNVRSVVYSPDDGHIASGPSDETVRPSEAATKLESHGRTVMHVSENPTSELQNAVNAAVDKPHPVSAFSCVAIPPERINSKGWVVGPEGLIFWVPEDCRYGLTHTPMMTIGDMRRDRGVRIDFTDFRYGTSWTEIYEKRTGEGSADDASS